LARALAAPTGKYYQPAGAGQIKKPDKKREIKIPSSFYPISNIIPRSVILDRTPITESGYQEKQSRQRKKATKNNN